jgi:hypothetical protein
VDGSVNSVHDQTTTTQQIVRVGSSSWLTPAIFYVACFVVPVLASSLALLVLFVIGNYQHEPVRASDYIV